MEECDQAVERRSVQHGSSVRGGPLSAHGCSLFRPGSILSKQQESQAGFSEEGDAMDPGLSIESSSKIALWSQSLTALKEKPAPELSLSSQDLEVGERLGA